ncbi:MAG TPA: glycosyltransferase family 2 protein [Tepidisphaeraceae bacterium]|nr:glycosyltransferase family 2 protein [Tepidisphaeraceae bacterium]
MRALIAIPVFNERQYLAGVMAKVRQFHKDILVIDDGSTDGSETQLRDLAKRGEIHLLRHAVNRGYGQSLIDAFQFAGNKRYDWVLTMDCDEQHEPGMIPVFLELMRMNDADVISGSRYLAPRNEDDAPPPDRLRINQVMTRLINERFNLGLTDSFCGFKAHRVCAMRKLRLDVPGYAFPMQFWPQVAGAGLRVKEVAVPLIYKDRSRQFGGELNDSEARLRHYMEVFEAEGERVAEAQPQHAACCCE